MNPLFKLSEIQVRYSCDLPASERITIRSSREAAKIFCDHWDEGTIELLESFKLLLLNRANQTIGLVHLSQGGTAGTVVDAKLVFAIALKANAHGLILAHNHPSGNLVPSQSDIDLTQKLREGARLLDLAVLDHLILTSERYYSFADEGVLQE